LPILALNELSAREIQTFAEDREKTDQELFKDLNWGLRTWDNWYFNDVDHRFGDDWPGRIPAQLVAHTLFYFTKESDFGHFFSNYHPLYFYILPAQVEIFFIY
jgi:hypothetical protein